MKRKAPKQQTLEGTLGQPPLTIRPPKKTRTSSRQGPSPLGNFQSRLTDGHRAKFMPTRKESRAGRSYPEDEEDEDDEPIRLSHQSRLSRPGKPHITMKDSDSDSDELPLSISRPPTRRHILPSDDSDNDGNADNDDDSVIIVTSARRRQLTRKSPATPATPPSKITRSGLLGEDPSSPTKRSSRSGRKGPRSEKQKKMELLRRRRQGEKIDTEDLTSSSDEAPAPLYDSDPELAVLEDFDDEEEEEEPRSPPRRVKGPKPSKAASNKSRRDLSQDKDDEDDLDGFVVEDDSAFLGAPAELLNEVPIQFTSHAHKPLRVHFRDAIEWLVQRRINPGFDREDPLYKLAWRKLDDEVRGLANSKFMSAGWKVEFHKALRARPRIESIELARGDIDRLQACHACGRKNHPATFKILFFGQAYNKDSLDDVEQDSSSESQQESEDEKSVDEDGNTIEPLTREWFVGVVCNANAKTAHDLMHVSLGEISPPPK